MTPLTAAAAIAIFALSACDQTKPAPEVVDTTAPDPRAAEIANRAPIELPPAVTDEVTFRCKDNSLVYVSFFSGEKQAQLKTAKDAAAVMLHAEEKGKPYIADGYSLTGTPKNITLTQPGKGALTCKG